MEIIPHCICPYEDAYRNKNEDKEELFRIGVDTLAYRYFGVIILAGGQGSRLGSDLPKALFKIAGKPLIEHHILRLKEMVRVFKCHIKLFIMVSSFTEKEIKAYLKDNDFGLPIETIKQEDRVCTDKDGNPLKDENDEIIKAPGGNGDVFEAFKDVDLHDFVCVNVISVDNVLANVLDPTFVGAFVKYNCDILSKAIRKKSNENVGVFIWEDKKLIVKEYLNLQSEETSLFGNICNHIFSRSFMEKMRDKELPKHSVMKKIPYFKDGNWVKPSKPNGYKTETFIFDSFEYAERNAMMLVHREYEFAPLKNGNDCSVDNPATCEQALALSRS